MGKGVKMVKATKKYLSSPYQRIINFSKKLKKNEEGVVAIEFAFVAIPFFFILFAILELSLVMIADINITHATADTARKVRTNQAGISTVSEFISDVCSQVFFVPDCNSKLKVEVQVYNDFSSVNPTAPINADGDLRDDFMFDLGTQGSVITVRTFLEWDLIAKLPNLNLLTSDNSNNLTLGNMDNGNRLIEGFAIFRNEG